MSYRPMRAVAPAFSHFSFMVILSCSTLIHGKAWADERVHDLPAGKAGTDGNLAAHRAHEPESEAAMAAMPSEKIMVHHHRSGKVEAAWNNLKKIPGGTSIIDSKDTAKRSNATNADIFKFQPGLFAQAVCGGDDLRISVRGSGVQDGLSATRYGINFFFDGLPLTTTAGAVNELQEPLGVQYTEVLRGGNAIDMGGTLLGGAINYVSKTGYDADRYHARVEAGSFGYVKEQLSSGGVYGKADYYLSVTNAYRGGYQQNTKTSSFGVNFNFGYKLSDHVDTRLFVRYRQTDEGYPGYLTRSQIAQDPTQAQKGYGNTSTNGYGTHTLEPGSYFVGDRTNIHFSDGSKFTLGFDYQNTPMDHRLQFTRLQYGIQNASGMLDYTRSDTLFGRKSETHVGVYTTAILSLWETQSVKDLTHYASYGAHVGQLISHDTFGGSTTTFHISNNYELFHNFWLTTAGALTYAPRQIAVTYPTYSDLHTQSLYFQPRAGFRYVVNPHIQFYGNVTRGEEPQTIWRYLTGPLYTSGLATGQNAGGTNIKPSTSTTFEVGTEGNWRGTDWSLTYYHSAIRNELLSVMTPESQLYNEVLNANASPTTHQGVEFSTHSVLYQWSGGVVSLRQAYTYQDFRFNHDPTFGHNRLPGIPAHFYQGQLHLDMKNGFYIAADAQVSSSVEASYDNTYRAAPYHIYNFQIGYQWPGKHRMVYVDLHNLANKHYATAVIPSYQAAGKEVAAMLPGDGLSVFAGIDIGFN
ncbi:TonB-dependent receptor [Komagataeibacter sp. AV436]|uniref:TonB-dependent receptor n=1 Tax=Komagataeibacter melomenusus TaxID=2766578 RepID=A0ABX2AB50_9PROT|nr:TonB-dependent receptor [Komagataeibacter melomenusus]MBV1829838.1 TonB-dependent receptor [Komagataeibacter melomenusus]NPC65326.1 TonB-dependent receptor [Komagataeibacter melomenusus]